MTEHTPRVLRIERTFDAPAQAVFEAWTSEEVMRHWFHANPTWDTPVARVDLRVGGEVRVVMRDPEDGAEHGATGEYTLIDPPHRLAFTWIWDHEPSDTQLIELEFTERDGVTTVVMVNSGIPTDEQRDDQEGGWKGCFDNLERTLATPSS